MIIASLALGIGNFLDALYQGDEWRPSMTAHTESLYDLAGENAPGFVWDSKGGWELYSPS